MKLNPDCIRDVLLTVEKCHQVELSQRGVPVSRPLPMKTVVAELQNQLTEDIVYSVIILKEAGYIEAEITQTDSVIANFHIKRLTYKGHEFLDEIRDGKIWSGVKEGANAIGSFSLKTLSDIARGLISSAVAGLIAHG